MKQEKEESLNIKLRTARKAAGLSQAQVALSLNIPRPSISEIESGRRKVSAEELSSLAALYGVSLSWLMDESISSDRTKNVTLQLVARELSKLNPEDIERLLNLLSSFPSEESED